MCIKSVMLPSYYFGRCITFTTHRAGYIGWYLCFACPIEATSNLLLYIEFSDLFFKSTKKLMQEKKNPQFVVTRGEGDTLIIVIIAT